VSFLPPEDELVRGTVAAIERDLLLTVRLGLPLVALHEAANVGRG